MAKNGINRIIRFFRNDLWALDPDAFRGLKRYGVKYLQIFALVMKDFWDDQCLLRAAALSFTSLLSLVPFCALMFALLKGLGVQNLLEPILLAQVAAGSEEVVSRIISYINNTNMTSLGAFGLVTLVVTAITLLGNIEEAFNGIWGVKETRTLQRKFSDYLSVVVSGPLLVVAATSITTSLQSQDLVKWLLGTSYAGDLLPLFFRLLTYVSIWIALVFLYIFIPNTTVRFRSALVGGVLAGTCWQLAQWGYLHFQVGVARYNAIYGTLAVLPVFMVWVYTSWLIVLAGVEVVYAHQNIRTFRREVRTPVLSHRLREFLALAVMEQVGGAFYYDRPPLSAEQLAEILDLPVRVVRELLLELLKWGFLVQTSQEPPCFLPARELEHIPVAELLTAVKSFGGDLPVSAPLAGNTRVGALLAKLEEATAAALAGMTVKDMVREQGGAPAARVDKGG